MRRMGWILGLIAGCGGGQVEFSPPCGDAGPTDDAEPPVQDAGPGAPCETDDDCYDGVACNGEERCDLERGCRPGVAVCDDRDRCTEDVCDESTLECGVSGRDLCRPEGCEPAPLDVFNSDPVDWSPQDISFDDACNAFVTTLVSGQDFVRKVTPAGVVTEYGAPADWNTAWIGASADGLDVYTIFPGYGNPCSSSAHVGWVDEGASSVIPILETTCTDGVFFGGFEAGPVGIAVDDTGQAIVGNLRTNGDIYRIDRSGNTTEIGRLPDRIMGLGEDADGTIVAATLDTVYRLRPEDGSLDVLAQTSYRVRSFALDAWSGLVYLELTDQNIHEIDPETGEDSIFAEVAGGGSLEVGPDGRLHRVQGLYVPDAEGSFERFPLPDVRQ